MNVEQLAGAADDRREFGGLVEIEPVHDAEARSQRRGDETRAGRRADQGEGRQINAHRTCRRTLANDQIQGVVLERGIEDLLDRRSEAVDLVDK